MEELGDLDRERCRARGRDPDPAAEALLELRVDEAVGDAVLESEEPAAAACRPLAESPARRPTPSAQSTSLRFAPLCSSKAERVASCTFSKMRGTPGSRCRPYVRERFGDPGRIGAERRREADLRAGEMEEPSEVVRERQPEQDDVLGLDQLGHLGDRGHHLVRVPVPDHARLRRAGRARGEDERVQVVLVDRCDRARRGRRGRRQRAPGLGPRGRPGRRRSGCAAPDRCRL